MARKIMGKKGAAQLQTPVNSDEDWKKLLRKEGLVVVDVYSGWCGPCVAMVGHLKKVKLTIGGDMLHLAIANADRVKVLQRFRDKSEPTWMFIGGGHLVNLMFGANAPRLTRLIAEELTKEAAVLKGERERESLPFDELTPEERVRFEAAEKIRLADLAEKEAAIELRHENGQDLSPENAVVDFEQAIHTALQTVWPSSALKAAAKAQAHRKLVKKLIEEVTSHTVVVYLPFTFSKEENTWLTHIKVMEALIPQGINITGECFKEMDYLTAWEIMHGREGEVTEVWKETLENGRYNVKLVEMTSREQVEESIAEEGEQLQEEKPDVIQMTMFELYGCNPALEGEVQEAAPDSLTMQYSKNGIPGLWTPSNLLDKAEALIALFPEFAQQFVEPEPEVLPPHLALFFRASVMDELEEILPEYEKEVLKLGIFVVDVADSSVTPIGRTPQDYHELKTKTGKERLVLIVDCTDQDAVLVFSEFEPVYVSPNEEAGEKDCQILFQQPVLEEDGTTQPFLDLPLEMIENLEGPPPELDEAEEAAMQAAAAAAQQANETQS